ncbi:MAG: hypothetical protein NVS4B8_25780 [Herpetosiphon sp.]
MPIFNLGPRAQRVYFSVRDDIIRGELKIGTKLPAHIGLAAKYGVAPLTMRNVLARLEEEGFVSREHGRGTFVRERQVAAVLIVENDPGMGLLLGEHVSMAGYRPVIVTTTVEALETLVRDSSITLIFSDVRMPEKETGIEFIRAVRRRWPELPLVAVTGFPDDLLGLYGSPECPILILTKPFWASQIEETLRLTLRT